MSSLGNFSLNFLRDFRMLPWTLSRYFFGGAVLVVYLGLVFFLGMVVWDGMVSNDRVGWNWDRLKVMKMVVNEILYLWL